MEIWFVLTSTICISFLVNALLSSNPKLARNLPPGPRNIPVLSSIIWLRKSGIDIGETIRRLTSKFGPIITLPVGLSPAIFISSRVLAHEALIQKGAIFADRPKPVPTTKIIHSNQHSISSAGYGPRWRTLRRNLISEILHPSRAREFTHARKWSLDILMNRLRAKEKEVTNVQSIKVMHDFRFAMFCLLVSMCFGEKLDESKIREIEAIQIKLLTSFSRFRILDRWPRITWVLLRSRWNELYDLKKKQKESFVPLIRKREELQDGNKENDSSRLAICYADTLLTLELFDDSKEKRKLNEQEIVAACSEFLNAGTDTTSTALEWIMANLVKYPDIQSKLLVDIKGVIGENAEEIEENNLSKMFYLKAIVLEGLRRHPPGHFVLQHAVTQEVELGGYRIPTDAIINFTVADMGRDPEVWDDPMKFWPERFMSAQEEFDITGSHEIKMMPFGAGRRICPGYGLAILHLEYFVANLVWNFEWKAADGYEVDLLSEKPEFTVVMKYPLQARVSAR